MSNDASRADALDAEDASDARILLEAWREIGADRLAPARYRLMDAMERRSAAYGGEARRRLDDRLAALIQAYETDLGGSAAQASAEAAPARGPLGLLADSLASPAQEDNDRPSDLDLRAVYPELPALEYFRAVWSRVSADRQVRQSQEQVHKNAGPLNSNQLVHRTLSLMRELSPGYLQQFLSYADALMWMEQIGAAFSPPAKEAPRAGARKTGRGKTR